MEEIKSLSPIRAANSIEGLISTIHYGRFNPNQVEILIMLTNYIREIPKEEISGFRITKLTESHTIFKELKEGFFDNNIKNVVIKLLEEYQHFEILKELL